MKPKPDFPQSPLAAFVSARLGELQLTQSGFCRSTGFDQGLLSKIQSSMITNLTLETALRLAVGLKVSPETILALIDRQDLHTLVQEAYVDSMRQVDGKEVAQALREWMASVDGTVMSDSKILKHPDDVRFLKNRLKSAFISGAFYRDGHDLNGKEKET